jgi:hypothetical protein
MPFWNEIEDKTLINLIRLLEDIYTSLFRLETAPKSGCLSYISLRGHR